MVESENEARILYTIEKGFILQSKGAYFEKIHHRAMCGEIAALCAAQHDLYTSNLLPMLIYSTIAVTTHASHSYNEEVAQLMLNSFTTHLTETKETF